MKKLLSVILAVLMCITAMTTAISVSAKETDTVVTTATDDITWNVSGGVLYVSGSGDMQNYSVLNGAPWSSKSSEIRKVVISENITYIGSYAFAYMYNLTYVQFDGNSKLTKVGSNAFTRCLALTDIVLPNSVKTVEEYAFYRCSAMENFTTNAPASFGNYVFNGCLNLKTVSTPKAKSFGYNAFVACDKLTKANLGNATLSESCLYYNPSLQSLTAGSLNKYAIQHADKLTSLNIKNAKFIKSYALFYVPKLTYINTNATSIDEYAFYQMSSLKSVTLPKIKGVANYLFYNANKLQTVKLGSAETIGRYAFAGCSNLTTITGTTKVKKVNDAAFDSCKKLKKFTSSNKLNYIGENAFFDCQKMTGSINFSNVTYVDDYAFCNCKSLASTINFKKVTNIGHSAFLNCQKLKGNTLGTKLKKLGSKAFLGCKSINSLYVPSTCKDIGYDMFVKNISSMKYLNGYYTYKFDSYGKKITIFGNKGSAIQSYAKSSKTPFKIAVKSVSVNKTKVTVKKGKTFKLKVYLSPSNCANKKVTLKSTNAKIATVSSNGTIKGVKKGKCNIIVISKDGSQKSKTVTVTVK